MILRALLLAAVLLTATPASGDPPRSGPPVWPPRMAPPGNKMVEMVCQPTGLMIAVPDPKTGGQTLHKLELCYEKGPYDPLLGPSS